MRVAHVNDIAFVGSTLVQALRSAGIDADLIETPKPGGAWPYPWKVATFPLRLGALAPAVLDLRRGRYDVVHVHYGRLGLLGRLSGRPYVIHCHGTDVREVRPTSLWGTAIRPFFRGAARVYFATPDIARWTRGLRSDAAFLANPIPLPEPSAPTAADTPRRDVLVGVRLDAGKGVGRIEDVLAALVRRRPGTSVTIVAHGAEIRRIRAAAGRDAVIEPVVPHADMPRRFRGHRVVIGQMRTGAIGNYELEALAAGVPVAAAFAFPDAYPVPPPVVDGSGAEAIAAALATLLDDADARDALGSAGRAWVGTYHDPATIATRLIADYANAAASG